tara:strand:- start:2488 stop:4353 length:1866 start_codon:yes stop_codon:yes gene_type:complete
LNKTQTIWKTKQRKNDRAKIPYAYKASDDDPLVLIPDTKLTPFIEEALIHLDNGNSFRKVSDWLTSKTGKKISHQGIANIWKALRDPKSNARFKALEKDKRRKAPKTKAEREERNARKKVATAKRSITVAKKKLAKYQDEESESFSDGLDFDAAPKEREIVFQPNEGPQTDFLAANEREVLYGGAAGSGKSYSILADPMRYFGNSSFSGLLVRRTNDELRELIWKSQELYPKAYKGAKWQEKKSQWVFPSGARLWMTYLEQEKDVLRYQGQAFCYIAFDELTQHPTPFAWNYMRSRLRSTDKSLPLYMRATTNPGGVGHGWVKRMFIDPSPENKAFPATDIETGEILRFPKGHPQEGSTLFERRFIPARLKDNPYLFKDGQYEANLLSLPENQRRQLLEGDWSVADGAAFTEFRLHHHVCEPFEIPENWIRFRSCDFGYSSFSAVHWFAIDPNFETLYVYRELYVSKHTGRDLAKAILNLERGEDIVYGVLDSSCWHNRGQIGPSIAEEMIAEGCRWRPSDRSAGARVAGKNRLHERMKVDPVTDKAGIVFFNTCRQIIADLPIIPVDPRGGDDIDSKFASDHTYDSIRYGVMSRPKAFSPWDFGDKPINQWKPADQTFGY